MLLLKLVIGPWNCALFSVSDKTSKHIFSPRERERNLTLRVFITPRLLLPLLILTYFILQKDCNLRNQLKNESIKLTGTLFSAGSEAYQDQDSLDGLSSPAPNLVQEPLLQNFPNFVLLFLKYVNQG